MAKSANKSNNVVNQIFNDLDDYRNFCRDYGYKFDEADLYKDRVFAYRQYTKFLAGKDAKNMWDVDSKSA
jgi:hypothetical protein